MARGRALLLLLLAAAAGAVAWVAASGSAGSPDGREAGEPAGAAGTGPHLVGRGRRGAPQGLDAPGAAPAPPYAGPWRLRLAGRVVTPTGEAVARATATLLLPAPEGWVPADEALAGPDGTFRLELRGGDPLGAHSVVTVEAPGHLYGFVRLAPLAAGTALDLGDVALRGPSGAIRGSVVDAEGRPLQVEVDALRESLLEAPETDEGGAADGGEADGPAAAPSTVPGDEPLYLLSSAARGAAASVATDAQGAFDTGPLAPGRYRLVVHGRGRHVREGVAAGTEGLRLVLGGEPSTVRHGRVVRVVFEGAVDGDLAAPPGGLPSLPVLREASDGRSGRVLRADPLPPPGVAGTPAEDAWRRRAWDGRADGLWRLDVEAGPRRLVVRALRGPHDDPRFGPAVLLLAEDGAEAEVRLPRAATLQGRVLREDERGQQPAAARVEVRYDLGPDGAEPVGRSLAPDRVRIEERVETSGDGAFEVAGLPPGRGEVRALPPSPVGGVRPSDPVEASAWQPVVFGAAGVTLVARPPARVTLHLRWPAGEPPPERLPSVSVVRRGDPARRALPHEVTRGDGYLVVLVSHLPAGEASALAVVCGDAWLETEPLLPRELPYLLDLRPAGRIEGRVLRPDGRPQRRGTVWAVPLEPAEGVEAFPRVSAALEAGGRFVLRPAAPGRYRLEVEDLEAGVVVPVEAETGQRGVELRARAGARVSGRVVGRAGSGGDDGGEGGAEGLSGFYVDAVVEGVPAERGEGAWCAADGWFELAGPGDRRVTLVARAEDPRDERCAVLELAPGSTRGVRLVLQPGARVAGRLLDAQGQPVPGAHLRLTSPLVDDEEQTDADGRFAFLGLPGASFVLEARHGAARVRQEVTSGDVELRLPAR